MFQKFLLKIFVIKMHDPHSQFFSVLTSSLQIWITFRKAGWESSFYFYSIFCTGRHTRRYLGLSTPLYVMLVPPSTGMRLSCSAIRSLFSCHFSSAASSVLWQITNLPHIQHSLSTFLSYFFLCFYSPTGIEAKYKQEFVLFC